MPRSSRARPLVPLGLVALALAALPSGAAAVGPGPQREGQGRFDARSGAPAVTALDASARRLARSLGPQAIVQLDPVTGTPRQVARTDGTLTGPSAEDPAQIALRYVATHADVFGLGAADLAALGAPRDYVSIDGTHHLRWRQHVDGVPVLGAEMRAHVTADGRLLAVQGSPLPDPTVANASPRLTAPDALGRVRRDAGATTAAPRVATTSAGAVRRTRFADGSTAQLVVFAGDGANRLAWQVTARIDGTHTYAYVLDAATGAVLKRENVVWYASGAGDAWRYAPSTGPTSGMLDGWSRDPVTYPDGWATTSGALRGMNVHVYPDPADEDEPNGDRPDGGEIPATDTSGPIPRWTFPWTPQSGLHCSAPAYPCSWNSTGLSTWETNVGQNATQVFSFVNTFHDHLALPPIGFTAAAGGFEAGPGGVGGDPVLAEVDDGAGAGTDPDAPGNPDGDHLNNANMATPADGTSPRMQMYLFVAPDSGSPLIDGNGGDDASVVYHEYTHGLSSRLVTDSLGGQALNSQQSGAMGEGWSDWYAIDYLVAEGLQADTAADGEIVLAAYLSQGISALRSESLDCTVGVPSAGCPNGGYTLADYGDVNGNGGPEVHADGEIWAQTLWDLRKAVGAADARRLVTRAMELSPPEPSFLDMRNAILLADQAAGGAFANAIWDVFAARGMGWYAADTDANDNAPIADFSRPGAAVSDATVSGTITDAQSGLPIPNAIVRFPSAPQWVAQTDAAGRYTVTLPQRTYPYLIAAHDGYDRLIEPDVAVPAGASTRDLSLRRNWALSSGQATVDSFTGADYTALGCGPAGAIDGSAATGWGSLQPARSIPTEGVGPGPRLLVLRLPQAVDVSGFEIDPGAVCGDDDSASLGSFRLETSPDGVAWSTAATGAFDATHNHRRNGVPATAGTGAATRFVRLAMLAPQGDTTDGEISAYNYMDVAELAVFGAATGTPDPDPGPGPGPDPGPPAGPEPPAQPQPQPDRPPTGTPPPRRSTPRGDTRPPKARIAKPRGGLAALRSRRGLALRITCDERCRASVTATIPAGKARRLGLTRKRRGTVTLARTAARRIEPGRTLTVRLKLSRATARRLRATRSLTLTLTVTARDAAGNARPKTVRLPLRR